jgi:hypothetical protein
LPPFARGDPPIQPTQPAPTAIGEPMKNESEKTTVRIDISKKQDGQQNPTKDTKVEQTDLTLNELEERIAPLRI